MITASSVSRLDECKETAMLAAGGPSPTEPADIASTRAAEALIARSAALISAGQFAPALVFAREAMAYTAKLDRPALSARANVAFGNALFLAGEKVGVLEKYEAAARLAAEVHDDVFVAEAYLSALWFVTINEKPGEVDRVTSAADTAIIRAGSPTLLVERLVGRRAEVAQKREKFGEAIPLFRRAIADAEARYGTDGDEVARHSFGLAQTLRAVGNFSEARTALQRAAAIMEKKFGTLHPNFGVVLSALGDVELGTGDYPAAIATYRRSIAVKEATLGTTHRSLTSTLINLASVLDQSGESTEAVSVAKRALEVGERGLPPGHPKLALALNVLGTAQMNAKDWAGAKISIERANAILDALGDEGAQADGPRNLARLRLHEKNLPAARAAAERALAIATKFAAAEGDSLDLVGALTQLARVQRADADSQADATYQRAIEMARKVAGAQHPVVVSLEAEAAGR